MPPTLIVLPEDVAAALRRIRPLTNLQRLHRLERRQPELACLLMETASNLNHHLRAHLPPKALRHFTHRIEDLGVMLAEAMAIAHLRQWQQHRHRRPIPPLHLPRP